MPTKKHIPTLSSPIHPAYKITAHMALSYIAAQYYPGLYSTIAVRNVTNALIAGIFGNKAPTITEATDVGFVLADLLLHEYSPRGLVNAHLPELEESFGKAVYFMAPVATLAYQSSKPWLKRAAREAYQIGLDLIEAAAEFSDVVHGQDASLRLA